MQRFFLTCAICLGLLAALQLYAQLMAPLTQAVVQPKQPPKMVSGGQLSSVASAAAKAWLPDEEWLKTADIGWQRSEQSFMFAQTVVAADKQTLEAGAPSQGDTIRMQPFAMIWKDPRRPDDPPLTIVAKSARVRFENQFFDSNQFEDNSLNLSGADSGRIVSAALEGKVRITGPDGLVLEGQDFIFREDPEIAQLYSDQAVNFRYGPPRQGKPVQVRGTSAVGLLIEFAQVPNSPFGDDMPRVAEIPKFAQLIGRVAIDFITEDSGQPQKTRVTSEGPFTYNFEEKTASFRQRVLVSRPRGKTHKVEIECNLLSLIFGEIGSSHESDSGQILPVSAPELQQPDEQEEQSGYGLISRLELKSVWARANQTTRERVTLRSTEHGLECKLDDLGFDDVKHMLTLTDPVRVDVVRNLQGQQQKFEAPKIEIRMTDDQQLEQLSGVGAGWFSHRSAAASQGEPDLWAHWEDRMDLVPNLEECTTELTIRGNATVGQLDQMQVSGQMLKAWMPPLGDVDTGEVILGSRSRQKPPKLTSDQVPVRRLQAIGNVTFVAAGVIGRKIDQIDIRINPGPVITSSTAKNQRNIKADAGHEDPLLTGEPMIFECSRVEGIAVFDATVQKTDIRELHGFEGVKAFRTTTEPEGQEIPFEQQSMQLTAQEFSVINHGGIQQLLTLRGIVDEKQNIRLPVIAKFGDISIEGPKVIIDRKNNLATIEGQGVLRFPVDRDFSGNELIPPAIADIACVEKITFDGQRATFIQKVKARLLDNVIKAEEMTAVLNERIDFSENRPMTRQLAIQTMQCKDKVSVEMYQWGLISGKDKLVEILKAQLHQFDMNQATGQFQGQGPGQIEDWRRTGTRRMLVQSSGTVQSNRPADTNHDYAWEYVGIEFKGQLEGNVRDGWGQLNDRVELMYAPVKNANLIFKRNDLSSEDQNAGNAVWVGSEQLTVWISGDRASGKPQSVSIKALGNAEMEGRNFYARAYSLEYEQAKEMFTLRGKGKDKATLHGWRNQGEPSTGLPAQVIQIFPSKQEVLFDGAKTFTTAFGGQ